MFLTMIFKTVYPRKLSLNLSKFMQMKMNIFLFRFLPFTLSRWYIVILGKLYYFFNYREKELIQETVRYVFRRKRLWAGAGLGQTQEAGGSLVEPADQKEELIQQTVNYVFKRKIDNRTLNEKIQDTFQGIFDHYHEKLFVAYSNFHGLLRFLRKRIRFAGAERLDEALAEGKGVILVTGHFGAVEFLPGALAVNGYPASMICRFQTNRLRTSLRQRAQWVKLDLIDADEGSIFLAATKALKQGRILITECDEFDEWRPSQNRNLEFLHNRLPSDRTLEVLRKRSGAPVITALIKREGRKKYTLNLMPVTNEESPKNIPVNEQCLRILETAVEAFPEQWYQWKKFGKLINAHPEVDYGRQESGYLAPEVGVPVVD